MNDHFTDRSEAGRLLAQRLAPYAYEANVVVLALPRGGLAVAFELAKALHLPLDILAVRKLGVPDHEELAFGAVAGGGVRIADREIIQAYALSCATVERVVATEKAELERRELLFRSDRPALSIRDCTVILVDDGIATGSTMLAAIAAVRQLGATRIVVAAGVAPVSTSQQLASEADDVVCLLTPKEFRAVSLLYDSFPQLTDEDVRDLLQRANQCEPPCVQ